MSRGARRAAAGLAIAAAPVALAALWLAVRGDLSERVATHIGHGRVDGYQRPGPMMAWVLPVSAVLAGAGIVAAARMRSFIAPATGAILGATAWLFAGTGAASLLASRGLADPSKANLGAWSFLFIFVAAAAGLGIWRLIPPGERPADQPGTHPAEPIPVRVIAPGEQVEWLGSGSSRVQGWTGAICLALGAATAIALWWAPRQAYAGLITGSLGLIAAGIAVGWLAVVHIRVDNRAVVISGVLGWPRKTIPLGSIEEARAELIEPRQWGGWGYRLSRRGTAIVLRRGPGIVLRRRGAMDFAITIDHPEQAVALLNALRAQAGAGR